MEEPNSFSNVPDIVLPEDDTRSLKRGDDFK
jgi:hypothetical protein